MWARGSELPSRGYAKPNFYVRTFAGEDVFLKPLHALSDLDLERAKAVLANFAVVLVLERLNDRDVIQLSQLLGWSITSVKPLPSHEAIAHGDAGDDRAGFPNG